MRMRSSPTIEKFLLPTDEFFSTSIHTQEFTEYCFSHLRELEVCMKESITAYGERHFLQYENEIAQDQNANDINLTKIQIRIAYFINLFLHKSYTTHDFNRYIGNNYPFIANLFADFLYAEGLDFLDMTSTEPKNTKKNLTALLFYFMSGTTDLSVPEKACYVQLLNDELKSTSSHIINLNAFTLEDLAQNNPETFIKLYNYLFNSEHEFSHHIKSAIEEGHIYVKVKFALFNLYLSFAYAAQSKIIHNDELVAHSQAYFRTAKTLFLDCLRLGPYCSIPFTQKHFDDLETHIALSIFYLQDTSYEQLYSHQTYLQLIQFNQIELTKHAPMLIPLLDLWIRRAKNPDHIKFATQNLKFFSRNNNSAAYKALKLAARLSSLSAVAFAEICIENANLFEINHAYLYLNQCKKTDDIYYYLYLTAKALNMAYFTYLYESAELGHSIAREEMNEYLKDPIAKNIIKPTLLRATNHHSNYAFNLLREKYDDTESKLSIAIYSLANNDTSANEYLEDILKSDIMDGNAADWVKLCNYTLKYSIESKMHDLAINRLKQYNDDNYKPAFKVLLFHAKSFFCITEYLISKFLSQEPSLERLQHLIELKEILPRHFDSPEKNMCLFQIDYVCFNNIRIDLLADAIIQRHQPALDEIHKVFLINNLENYFKNRKIILKEIAVSSSHGITILIGALNQLASEEGPLQYQSSCTLIAYYLNHNQCQNAEGYIHNCLAIDPDKFLNSPHMGYYIKTNIIKFSDDTLLKLKNTNPYKFHCLLKSNFNDLGIIKEKRTTFNSSMQFFSQRQHDRPLPLLEMKAALKLDITTKKLPQDFLLHLLDQMDIAHNGTQLVSIRLQMLEFLNNTPRPSIRK